MQQHHYVCSECGSVSKLAGTCQNDDCLKQGMRLKECHCDDDRHEMVIESHKENEGDDPEAQEKEADRNGYSTTMIDLDNNPEF